MRTDTPLPSNERDVAPDMMSASCGFIPSLKIISLYDRLRKCSYFAEHQPLLLFRKSTKILKWEQTVSRFELLLHFSQMARQISWLSHNHLVSSLIGTKLKYSDRCTVCLQVCLVFVNSLHQSIIYIHFTIYFHAYYYYYILSWSVLSISQNPVFTNYPLDIRMTPPSP